MDAPFLPPIPGHLIPLDVSFPWVQSTQYHRWHLTEDGCRYAGIIELWNRDYRADTPPVEEMCGHCLFKWRKLQRGLGIAV